ncbi:hypothetical protein MP228_008237 [Amoeboaphelidium protococcarum]|nr:hypothetical protein MP228_008237 [Amoeboaphelidium protococcarum]
MGAAQSQDLNLEELGPKVGFHVLDVKQESPAHQAGLEAYFSYVLSINDVRLSEPGSAADLVNTLRENIDKEVQLLVYNSKLQSLKQLTVVPSTGWPGCRDDEILGCSLRFCSFQHAGEQVWHVTKVHSKSPAEDAELIPNTDYIIGAPLHVLQDKDDLFRLVQYHMRKDLRLIVYNWAQDRCREVIIVPNDQWGGEGSLGCDIGYGILHKIPNVSFKDVDKSPGRELKLEADPPTEKENTSLPASPGNMAQQKKVVSDEEQSNEQ